MENPPVKKRLLRTPAPIFLAGVFLVGCVAALLAFRSGTIVVPPSIGGGLASVISGEGGSAVASVTTSTPVRLKVPKLGVDSAVQYVGLTPEGDMDTPKSAVDVAWYKLGPVPGEAGNSVIAGHINTRYSAHGVFEHLDDLNAGDEVHVTTAAGEELTFRVTHKKHFNDGEPAPDVFGPANGIYLNLVTCAGTWEADKRSYSQRLVVYTELVRP